jgi:hypothetical protein
VFPVRLRAFSRAHTCGQATRQSVFYPGFSAAVTEQPVR